ncbi:hypothetical protein HPB47_004701 [Ixodes persulcatus]|uniref:Uncharacterized protein n=1 Tax=Ixodes persulcatus TaxID=34615 RepID=A0AC60PG94_IXOPE|nr:hypothetical protein HPB47_004701 [Ixodes persulcatus]
MTSSYYRRLPSNDRVRYEQTLTCLGGCAIIDPFDPSNAGLFNEEQRLYPQVTWPELHDYLINTPGLFTRERLKAYKSLEAHNYFISGKVTKVKVCQPRKAPSVRLLLGRVTAGQKESKAYDVWSVAEQSGPILSAHCTLKDDVEDDVREDDVKDDVEDDVLNDCVKDDI